MLIAKTVAALLVKWLKLKTKIQCFCNKQLMYYFCLKFPSCILKYRYTGIVKRVHSSITFGHVHQNLINIPLFEYSNEYTVSWNFVHLFFGYSANKISATHRQRDNNKKKSNHIQNILKYENPWKTGTLIFFRIQYFF